MTTTDVMEGEDIGGLIRRHFLSLGLAAGLAVGGVASAVLWSNNNNTPISENPAVIVQTEEKSEKYKTLVTEYAKQIEAGKKYVAEKYDVSTEQVEAVVLDEIKQGDGPEDYNSSGSILVGGGSPVSHRKEFLPEDESGLYAAYAHPGGYAALTISQNSRIQPDFRFFFCTEETRRVVNRFLRVYPNKEIAVFDIQKLKREDIIFYGDEHSEPKSDQIYGVYFADGWEPFYRKSEDDSYAIDMASGKILGRISFGFHFIGKECE